MLAYLFWHRPLDDTAIEAYEQAQVAFHRSLARSPPAGLRGSAVFRVAEIPWLPPPAGIAPGQAHASYAGYEDWYLLEDYAALGVLNQAAVGRGHRSAHDDVARRFGAGAGGLYGLIEGDWPEIGRSLGAGVPGERPSWSGSRGRRDPCGASSASCSATASTRCARACGGASSSSAPLQSSACWPPSRPRGVAPTRLPDDWTATVLARETLWNG